ncbi:hypothetical protein ABIF91_005718 [Bradyrhizobium sp. USDA 241]
MASLPSASCIAFSQAARPAASALAPDDLAGAREIGREIGHDGGVGADRVLLVGDVAAAGIVDQPFVGGEQPDVGPKLTKDLQGPLGCARGNQVLLDRPHLGIDDRGAVERADRQPQRQRLDQEAHADRGAAGGDGEADAGLVQPLHRASRALGQRLVLGQQRAVDVGDHE